MCAPYTGDPGKCRRFPVTRNCADARCHFKKNQVVFVDKVESKRPYGEPQTESFEAVQQRVDLLCIEVELRSMKSVSVYLKDAGIQAGIEGSPKCQFKNLSTRR